MTRPFSRPDDRRGAIAIGSIMVWLVCAVGLLDLGTTAYSSWRAWHRGYPTEARVAAKRAQEAPWFQGFVTLDYTSDGGIPASGEYPVERVFFDAVDEGDLVSIQLAPGWWRYMDFEGQRRTGPGVYLFLVPLLLLTTYLNLTITLPWVRSARGKSAHD